MASKAPSVLIGGVAVFFRAAEHFYVEALHLHGANVVIFQMASGVHRWYIMGCYLDPDYDLNLEGVVAAISQRPRGAALLVARNFNSDLAAP